MVRMFASAAAELLPTRMSAQDARSNRLFDLMSISEGANIVLPKPLTPAFAVTTLGGFRA